MQEDAAELADPIRLAKLIKQYSQFIQFPIKLWSSRKEAKQIVDEAATQKRQEEADKVLKEGEEQKKVRVLLNSPLAFSAPRQLIMAKCVCVTCWCMHPSMLLTDVVSAACSLRVSALSVE